MDASTANSVAIVVLIVGSACLVGESVRALRRSRKREGKWIAGSATAMLATGLALWLLRGKFASPLMPYVIAGIFAYITLYCILQFQRVHLRVPS